ncbi:MAG: PD-(D/E)XK nuclease family transposase [candidate division KSB1 bacterium]
MARYLDPTTDFGFKKIFGEEANKEIISSFVTDVLELETPLVDLSFLNKEQLPEIFEQRAGVYDLFCTDRDGNHFIVEMQKSPIAYIKDRMVYYSTFPITQQAPKGGMMRVADHADISYGKNAKPKPKPWDFRLDAVYCIAILGYEMNGSTRAVNRNSIRNDYPPHELFYPKLRYLTIELPLFDESNPEYSLDQHLNKWLYFLKYLPELDRIPEIFANEVVFQKAFFAAELANLSQEEFNLYQRNLKYHWDDYAKLTTAENIGLAKGTAEGMIKGKLEGKFEVATAMLKEGSDTAFIAKVTGLSEEQVRQLHTNKPRSK